MFFLGKKCFNRNLSVWDGWRKNINFLDFSSSYNKTSILTFSNQLPAWDKNNPQTNRNCTRDVEDVGKRRKPQCNRQVDERCEFMEKNLWISNVKNLEWSLDVAKKNGFSHDWICWSFKFSLFYTHFNSDMCERMNFNTLPNKNIIFFLFSRLKSIFS